MRRGRVGGANGTAATDEDLAPEVERQPLAAPPEDEREATAAHVSAGTVRVSDPAPPRGVDVAAQRHIVSARPIYE